ncbi:hypothetical protein [Mesorhizobium sp. IMUNJ 23232]|uniref:hypothetical protein n=1 Tax=Mesorhizobium sp. IMUNJ 23232 TaxID=3376064 RepID=UPI003794F068
MRVTEIWAEQAAVPQPMILRNLCDWAVTDAFPPGAFVWHDGTLVDPLDIYRSFRALTPGVLDRGNYLDGLSAVGGSLGWPLLSRLMVLTDGLLAFCKTTDTSPPTGLHITRSPGMRFWQRERQAVHAFPPPCPNAATFAQKRDAPLRCQVDLAVLRETLHDLNNGTWQYGELCHQGDLQHATARWKKIHDHVERLITLIGDNEPGPTLRDQLAQLDQEWVVSVSRWEVAGIPTPEPVKPHLTVIKSLRRVTVPEVSASLTPMSFNFILCLVEHALENREFVGREALQEKVLGQNRAEKAATQAFYRLKKELIEAGIPEEFAIDIFETLRNAGYRINQDRISVSVEP